MFRISVTSALVAIIGLTVLGCGGSDGPRTYPVTGVATLDGEPVEGATVTFVPQSDGLSTAMGKTDASGRFSLVTPGGQSGAEPGRYNVIIMKREGTGEFVQPEYETQEEAMAALEERARSGGLMQQQVQVRDLLPLDYSRVATSGLEAEVTTGSNQFDFPMTSR